MQKLFILKVGTTFPRTAEQFGDFHSWILDTIKLVDITTLVVDVENGEELPPIRNCAGVIVTGSHAMVTEELPWSIRLEEWIPSLLQANVPLLGVCYGHQLLAKIMGGQVDYHPGGKEIGTVKIQLNTGYINDTLFQSLPQQFDVHVSHSQTVLRLPAGAVRLAENSHDPNQAFRLGDLAWGVQFHPEYDANIMRSYILEQAEELESKGQNVSELLRTVRETPESAQMLRNFAQIVQRRLKDKGKRQM